MDDLTFYFSKILYLFIFREKGKEREREGEKHQCVVTSHLYPLGTWPATQACARTGNQTCDLLVRRPELNPLIKKKKKIKKCYSERYRGSRSEPSGLLRIRKQVTEAKEESLELRREKVPGWRVGGKGAGVLLRGRASLFLPFLKIVC